MYFDMLGAMLTMWIIYGGMKALAVVYLYEKEISTRKLAVLFAVAFFAIFWPLIDKLEEEEDKVLKNKGEIDT